LNFKNDFKIKIDKVYHHVEDANRGHTLVVSYYGESAAVAISKAKEEMHYVNAKHPIDAIWSGTFLK